MSRFLALILCVGSVLAGTAQAQKSTASPLQIPAGSILTFHLQTRLHPTGDALDALPKGTELQVKILESIDSRTARDGSEFHGTLVSPLLSGTAVVMPMETPVHGILALLRSRNHPEGFRYELLVTGITDQGQQIPLTASLNSSFADSPSTTSHPAEVPAAAPLLAPGALAPHR